MFKPTLLLRKAILIPPAAPSSFLLPSHPLYWAAAVYAARWWTRSVPLRRPCCRNSSCQQRAGGRLHGLGSSRQGLWGLTGI